ncbi:MAG: hypothetical protein FWG64_13090 [Firmicutes bacterium]|nr:hypothetical protein [Bacillota bacterium]
MNKPKKATKSKIPSRQTRSKRRLIQNNIQHISECSGVIFSITQRTVSPTRYTNFHDRNSNIGQTPKRFSNSGKRQNNSTV